MNIINILYFIIPLLASVVSRIYKLEQLQVLFRHGDRIPDKTEVLKNDPYIDIYESYGYGELTKIGKEREFHVGEVLRKRYGNFLKEYHNGDVYAISTSVPRAIMSLTLVLKGLYPTITSDPCSIIDCQTGAECNNGFFFAFPECSAFSKLENDAVERISKLLSKKDLNYLRFISEKSGVNITNYTIAPIIYNNLLSILSLDLPLPNGYSMDDFHKIEKSMSLSMWTLTYTENMKKIIIGPLVNQFLKIFNDDESKRKIYLYSGHDINIAAFVNAHNISGTPGVPGYGSALVLEKMRGLDQRKYIRMYLWTGVSKEWISLKINHCNRTCPLSEYEKMVQPILPDETSTTCSLSNEFACPRH